MNVHVMLRELAKMRRGWSMPPIGPRGLLFGRATTSPGIGRSRIIPGARGFMSDSSYTAMNEVVENTGSTARDHLANERTFLAWCGQAMNFMGAGIALFSSYELLDDQGARKDEEERDAISGGWKVIEPAGLMILNSAIVVTYATWNYFRVQKCLSRGNFPQNKIGVTSIVLATGTSSLLALYLMASERDIVLDHIREAREKAILQKRSTVSCKAQDTVKQQQKEQEQEKHQKVEVGKSDRPPQ